MNAVRRTVLAILCMFALCGVAQADPLPTLVLDPVGGAISGPAGTTVGWGFTLTNPGTNFLLVTGSDFCVGLPLSPCSNSLGTYTDLVGPQNIGVGSSGSLTQAFDNILVTGLGSFLINPAATGSVSGEIVLSYDLYTANPLVDPTATGVSFGNSLTAPASVTVTTRTVPEPGSMLLLASGLLALGACARSKASAG